VKEGQPPSPRTASQRFVQVSGAQRLTAGGGVGESSRKGARGLTGRLIACGAGKGVEFLTHVEAWDASPDLKMVANLLDRLLTTRVYQLKLQPRTSPDPAKQTLRQGVGVVVSSVSSLAEGKLGCNVRVFSADPDMSQFGLEYGLTCSGFQH
jgi:hypothetical protein